MKSFTAKNNRIVPAKSFGTKIQTDKQTFCYIWIIKFYKDRSTFDCTFVHIMKDQPNPPPPFKFRFKIEGGGQYILFGKLT